MQLALLWLFVVVLRLCWITHGVRKMVVPFGACEPARYSQSGVTSDGTAETAGGT
jgi:hypothetical protein